MNGYCVHVFADFVDKRAIYKVFVHNISENVDEIYEVRPFRSHIGLWQTIKYLCLSVRTDGEHLFEPGDDFLLPGPEDADVLILILDAAQGHRYGGGDYGAGDEGDGIYHQLDYLVGFQADIGELCLEDGTFQEESVSSKICFR